MAHRRIRQEDARGNMGEYGNVWDGMGEDTVVDGATAKENLAVGAEGLRFALDEDGGYFPAPDEWGTAYTSMSGKGLQAIEFLLKKQDGFVPAAFNRSDLGDIDIVYGRTGEGIDDGGGYGLAHIMKRHPDINWNKIVDVISNGSIRSGGKKKKIIISDDGKIILRVKQKGRNWVISAFSNTSAEEILSASAKNGSDANIYRKGIYTIGDVFDNVKPDGEKNRKNDNFRFLLAEFSEAERREKNRLEYNRKRDQYLYDNFPFYREAVEFAGSHDFKIKPSGKFRGEEFSGSFIAPGFVKYSGEKAAKNSGKLDAAQGVNSNELAARLARSWGRDHLASSFNPAIPTIMAKIQSIRRIEAVSLKNIIPQITAPTVPIPVQIAYAVPSGSVLVANARPMMLPVIAAITMIDGTSLVKPWLYFIATAQQTSNIPAKNKYNHAIKYLHKKTAAGVGAAAAKSFYRLI